MSEPGEDPQQTPFSAILRYVLGFMAIVALLAFVSAWLLRHC